MKLSPEEKKQCEIAKWEREKDKPKGPGYLIYFIMIVTVIYIADEIATQISSQMQSVVASQVFAPIVGEDFAVARMSALSTVTAIFGILAFVYKPLSDRYGRKIFLVINTLGMGLGMFLVGISTSIPIYLMGACVIAFFIPHDMQAVYIQESTPPQHRAKIYSAVKSLATLGMFLIPLMRRIFISDGDMSRWRMVYLIPALVPLIVATIALFCIRESDAFVETRLRQLKMTDEEKAAELKSKQDSQTQGGLIKAIKFAFTHKQLKWLFISYGFFLVGMLITSYYESIMNFGYAQQFLKAGMSLADARAAASELVTQALLLFVVGSSVSQFIPGFIADKWGRKLSTVVMSAACLIFFIGFYAGSNLNWNPYLVGIMCGASVGSFWAAGDMIMIMCSESAPTNIRASVLSVQPIVGAVLPIMSTVIVMILTNTLGDAVLGPCCLIISGACMAISLALLIFKTKETRGVDMGSIRGDEFES